MATDLTIEILIEIRDGVRDLREDMGARIEALREDFNARLDQTNARLDQTNARLENVEHGLNDLGKFMRQIALDQARHERFHGHHVERLEADMEDLRGRVERLEQRAGT